MNIYKSSFLIAVVLCCSAQSQEPLWSKGVYRLEATGCPQGPRISTAFKVAGEVGVLTSLHGVIGCSNFKLISANGVNRISDLISVASVSVDSDLAFLTSGDLAKVRPYGISLSSNSDIKRSDTFSVPGYAYSLVSTMESVLVATDASAFKPLRNILPPDIKTIYAQRGSPSLDADAIYLQGPLAKGQSGAPILNQASQVVAVVEGGAGAASSNYIWAIKIPAPTGGFMSAGSGWKPYRTADTDIHNLIAVSGGSDPYYAAPEEIAQEIVLEDIQIKESGHLVKTPDWDLVVTVDNKAAFSLPHNRQRANNPLRGQFGGLVVLRGDELIRETNGVASTATFASCGSGQHLHLVASITDNWTHDTFSNATDVPCERPGSSTKALVDIKSHTNLFNYERFVIQLSTKGLRPPP